MCCTNKSEFIIMPIYSLNALSKKNKNIQSKKNRGFTLVELMVTIAVVAIISAIALPSMSNFIVKMRVDNQITELQRLLLTARNNAINTEQNTSVCPLSGNVCATNNNWHGEIGVISADGVIKEKSAIQTGDKLQFEHSNIVYTPSGQLNGNSSGTFSYCPSGFPENSRAIDVSISGRTYISSDIDNDGKDEDRNNNEITCS